MDIQTKDDIIRELGKVSKEFTDYCSTINEHLYFQQPQGKWSIAQNVKHLTTSARITILAFSFPKIVVRVYAGKPNRPSRSYDELVAKYILKLAQGGKASGRFIPKPISENEDKEKMLQLFSGTMQTLADKIQKKWEDPQLDQYIAPHPLLGKITLRELGFFTIHHTKHHFNTIKERLTEYRTLP